MISVETRTIHSAMELAQMLRELKQAVAQGVVRQVHPRQTVLLREIRLEDIPDKGPWPDYIEMYFEDVNTRDVYRLSVETYHGIGGSCERA